MFLGTGTYLGTYHHFLDQRQEHKTFAEISVADPKLFVSDLDFYLLFGFNQSRAVQI